MQGCLRRGVKYSEGVNDFYTTEIVTPAAGGMLKFRSKDKDKDKHHLENGKVGHTESKGKGGGKIVSKSVGQPVQYSECMRVHLNVCVHVAAASVTSSLFTH